MPSGTGRFSGPCQPALSSCRTMMRSRPAPVCCAKAASSLAKNVDSVGEIPHRLAARRRDETGYVEPFVAMVTERDRPLADRRPNPAMDRLQTQPMLVRGPHLDGLVGMLGGFFGNHVGEFFYKPPPPRSSLPAGCGDAATGSTNQSP